MSTASTPHVPAGAGAYGLTLAGPLAPAAGELFIEAPPGWPPVELSWQPLHGDVPAALIGPTGATTPLLGGGHVSASRNPAAVTFHTHEPPDVHALAHPGLASVGALASWWQRGEAFHGGAVMVGDGAWGVLAGKEGGKSTLLAWLATAGHDVLADDLLVIRGGRALAGPRAVDLRPAAAERVPDLSATASVRDGTRTRLILNRCAAEVALRGWLLLMPGERVELRSVPAGERLGRLGDHRAVRKPSADPAGLLGLAALPTYELRRPMTWDAMPAVIAFLRARLPQVSGRATG